jgi:predicted DNA-binding transcriptional regulator AlpA
MHIDKRCRRIITDPVSDGDDDEMLSTQAVADWLGVSTAWLEMRRHGKEGPPFIRIGPKCIKYRRGAVRAWLEKRSHFSTAEYSTRRMARR